MLYGIVCPRCKVVLKIKYSFKMALEIVVLMIFIFVLLHQPHGFLAQVQLLLGMNLRNSFMLNFEYK